MDRRLTLILKAMLHLRRHDEMRVVEQTGDGNQRLTDRPLKQEG